MSDLAHSTLDVEATLRLMDVADELKRRGQQDEQVLTELAAGSREKAKAQLLRIYDELDESIDPALVDEAIDTFLREQHRFRKPGDSVSIKLAHLYIRRVELAKRYSAPVAAVALAVTLGWAAQWQWSERSARLEAIRLEDAQAQTARRIADVRALESVPDPMRERAEDAHRLAAEAIEQRRWEDYDEHERELSAAAADAEKFVNLAPAAPGILAAIRDVAKEPSVVEQAVELHQDAERYLAEGDLSGLERSVGEMRRLENFLRQEVSISIAGGVWRYQNDNPNVRNYYLRVVSKTSDGRDFQYQITNEETGRVETVSEWAERVPKETYDRVAADKTDNGIIDDDVFALKERGYLTPKRSYPNLGQITRW